MQGSLQSRACEATTVARTVAGASNASTARDRKCEDLEEIEDEVQKSALGTAGEEHVGPISQMIRRLDDTPAKR